MSAHTLDQEWKDGYRVKGRAVLCPRAACPSDLGRDALRGFFTGELLCSAGSGYDQKCLPRVHVDMNISHIKPL